MRAWRALFPFSDNSKWMFMATEVWGYMDETGHSQDERQRFNGMAGLIAPCDHWEEFERKWKEALKKFHIPRERGFHMVEFENSEKARYSTSSKNIFKDWSALKKEKLFSKLLKIIETIHPFPLGSIMSMDDYRSLSQQQRAHFDDPYYLGFLFILGSVDVFLDKTRAAPEVKAAIIFSDQVEFRHRALEYYENAYSKEVSDRIKPPAFDDMRTLVPLQAADIVAYEFYKECERRRYRPNEDERPGYKVLTKMCNRLGFSQPLIKFQEKPDLIAHAENVGKHLRRLQYWQKRAQQKGST